MENLITTTRTTTTTTPSVALGTRFPLTANRTLAACKNAVRVKCAAEHLSTTSTRVHAVQRRRASSRPTVGCVLHVNNALSHTIMTNCQKHLPCQYTQHNAHRDAITNVLVQPALQNATIHSQQLAIDQLKIKVKT